MKKRPVLLHPLVKKGQSLLEMALTMLILLELISGLADFGIAFFSYISLRDAAAEGALFGSVNPVIDADPADGKYTGTVVNTDVIVDRIRRSSSSPVDLTDLADVTINVTYSTPACAGGWITVDVLYNYHIITPLIAGNTIPLRATVTDTILRPGCP